MPMINSPTYPQILAPSVDDILYMLDNPGGAPASKQLPWSAIGGIAERTRLRALTAVGALTASLGTLPLGAFAGSGWLGLDPGTVEYEVRKFAGGTLTNPTWTPGLDYGHAASDPVNYEKLPTLRPCDFYASVGNTAAQNDTAIQRMIDQAVKIKPCSVVFPENYLVTGGFTLVDPYGVQVMGYGSPYPNYATLYGPGLRQEAGSIKNMFEVSMTGVTNLLGLTFKDLFILGNRVPTIDYTDILDALAANSGHGVKFTGCQGIVFDGVTIWGMPGSGIAGRSGAGGGNNLIYVVNHCRLMDNAIYNVDFNSTADSWIIDSELGFGGKGIYLASRADGLSGAPAYGYTAFPVSWEVAANAFLPNKTILFLSNRVYQAVGWNIRMFETASSLIALNIIDGSTRSNILVHGSDNRVFANISQDAGATRLSEYTPGDGRWLDEYAVNLNRAGVEVQAGGTKNNLDYNQCYAGPKTYKSESYLGAPPVDGIVISGDGNRARFNDCYGNESSGIRDEGNYNELMYNNCHANGHYGINKSGGKQSQIKMNTCRLNEFDINVTGGGDAYIGDNDLGDIYGTDVSTLDGNVSGGDSVISVAAGDGALWTAGDIFIIAVDDIVGPPSRTGMYLTFYVDSVNVDDITIKGEVPGVGVVATSGNWCGKRLTTNAIRLTASAGVVDLGDNRFAYSSVGSIRQDGGTLYYDKRHAALSINFAPTSLGQKTLTIAHGMKRTPLPSEVSLTIVYPDASTVECNIRSASFAWTLSGLGTNEYYCRTAALADPKILSPTYVSENSVNMTYNAVLGTLAAGEWGYGNNDALGYSTVYVRLADGTDPDGKAAGWVKCSRMWATDWGASPFVGVLDATNITAYAYVMDLSLWANSGGRVLALVNFET